MRFRYLMPVIFSLAGCLGCGGSKAEIPKPQVNQYFVPKYAKGVVTKEIGKPPELLKSEDNYLIDIRCDNGLSYTAQVVEKIESRDRMFRFTDPDRTLPALSVVIDSGIVVEFVEYYFRDKVGALGEVSPDTSHNFDATGRVGRHMVGRLTTGEIRVLQ